MVILIPLVLYFSYCCHHFLTTETHPTYSDCGTVMKKETDEHVRKHTTISDYYLIVKFQKSGTKLIKTDVDVYYLTSVGDTVCYNLDKKVDNWYNFSNFVGFGILVFLGIFGISFLIIYLFFAED